MCCFLRFPNRASILIRVSLWAQFRIFLKGVLSSIWKLRKFRFYLFLIFWTKNLKNIRKGYWFFVLEHLDTVRLSLSYTRKAQGGLKVKISSLQPYKLFIRSSLPAWLSLPIIIKSSLVPVCIIPRIAHPQLFSSHSARGTFMKYKLKQTEFSLECTI